METLDTLCYTKIPLTRGSGANPAVGFGTLIPDPLATKQTNETAVEVGLRHLDCMERDPDKGATGDASDVEVGASVMQLCNEKD